MDADYVLEDLADGEEEGGGDEVYWKETLILGFRERWRLLTHRFLLAEDSQDEDCF